MKSVIRKMQWLFGIKEGPTAEEYAVMLALLAIVCLTAFGALGS